MSIMPAMASSRRPRGLRPDLRGTLGTLVRSTLAQAGVVRDVLERGAREGRARLDDVRRDRRRTDALAALGEAVMDAVRAGELAEVFDVAAVSDAIAEVEELERAEAEPADEAPRWAPTPRGARYDRDDRDEPPRREPLRREPPARRDRSDEPGARFRVDDDGTVSSASWRPPPREPAVPARPREPAVPSRTPPAARPAPARPAPARPAPARAGGIQFGATDDDEDDLAQYMHPDDVPPRSGGGTEDT